MEAFSRKTVDFLFTAAILPLIIEIGPKYVFQGSFASIYPENQRLGGLVNQKVGVSDIFKHFYLIIRIGSKLTVLLFKKIFHLECFI